MTTLQMSNAITNVCRSRLRRIMILNWLDHQWATPKPSCMPQNKLFSQRGGWTARSCVSSFLPRGKTPAPLKESRSSAHMAHTECLWDCLLCKQDFCISVQGTLQKSLFWWKHRSWITWTWPVFLDPMQVGKWACVTLSYSHPSSKMLASNSWRRSGSTN